MFHIVPRNCKDCGKAISAGRLSVLPDTDVCVRCSTEPARDDAALVIDQADAGDMRQAVTNVEPKDR